MAKAIIFGINGQDGYYLQQLLHQQKIEVKGVSRSVGDWLQADVSDEASVKAIINKEKPDYVFHLAATSSISPEFDLAHRETIIKGTENILRGVKANAGKCRVFITGSGLQFENNGTAISEKTPFISRDAYTEARIESVQLAREYRDKGLNVFVGYLFHHDSPLRRGNHLNRCIADKARAVAAGENEILQIGDTLVEKEFGFAGDICAGMLHLVMQDEIAEACIGTGKAYTIEKWLELCFDYVKKDWRDYVVHKNDYIAGFKRMVSDPSLLQSSGWKPKVEIEELSKMMMGT